VKSPTREDQPGLDSPVRYLPGVGAARAERYGKLGISTLADLLALYPRRYVDASRTTPIAELVPGQPATVVGLIRAASVRPTRRMPIFAVALDDGTGHLEALFFNQPFLKDSLRRGLTLLVHGEVSRLGGRRAGARPGRDLQIQPLEWWVTDAESGGRIVPVYPATEGLFQKQIRRNVETALELLRGHIPEILPAALLTAEGLPAREPALRSLHLPRSWTEIEAARARIVFEELFLWELTLALLTRERRTATGAPPLRPDVGPVEARLRALLPFELTRAQDRVAGEILKDAAAERPMSRLLQGDVGSGKTVVAALVLARAADSGVQGAIMAPTQILAEQHATTLAAWLEPAGLNVGFLSATVKGKARDDVLRRLADGMLPVVVGTHALLQDDVRFKRLGLVVVDEQHRFGVEQRLALAAKGRVPHVLVMTATPIPRSLALSLYADLEVSVVDEMPRGRKPVRTRLVPEEKRGELYGFLRRRMAAGDQIFVVVPLIDESAVLDLQTAKAAHERYAREIFPDVPVGLVHGRLSAEERSRVMDAYRRGEIRLLVSTTVIEVGVDVAAANLMVIENAERFGLAQLHQLRGRIGRGGREAWCFLFVSPGSGAESVERLQVLRRHADGFRIAEEDLRLRGPGDFFGTQQHGVPRFVLADLALHTSVLARAKAAAFDLVSRSPGLAGEELEPLRQALARTYAEAARYYAQG
jgi:ATP-dependent DNA helicase RecG